MMRKRNLARQQRSDKAGLIARETMDRKSGQNLSSIPRPLPSLCRLVFAIILGIALGIFYYGYLNQLFENDRHFSHLTDFEREMSYRTEMGFYYSYYKSLINEESFVLGLQNVINDNSTEYGHTVNALKRFNIYPEVTLAAMYRLFKDFTERIKWNPETCYKTYKNPKISSESIVSCEGIGSPHYFYVYNVFIIAATVIVSLYTSGIILSDSIFGGFLSAVCFIYNQGECSRVQWTPPLRESFGYPIFAIQMTIMTYFLKHKCTRKIWIFIIAIPTISFFLVWQLAAFALTTQICALFLTFQMGCMSERSILTILYAYMLSFLVSFSLLFGNEMLLCSFFICATITFFLLLKFGRILKRMDNLWVNILVKGTIFAVGTIGMKITIGKLLRVEDDAHIFELFLAKFTNFSTFHTQLYLCAKEFDFLTYETVDIINSTLLLPIVAFVFLLLMVRATNEERPELQSNAAEANWRIDLPAEMVYNGIQCIFFGILAFLIMRLKLFFVPHLCIMISIITNSKFMSEVFQLFVSPKVRVSLIVLLLASVSVKGISNVKKQLSIIGEFSDPEQEDFLVWIQGNTKSDAVFAGTMPVMANVKLSTNRAIVNHPHYEDSGLRNRTLRVYAMFSRKPLKEIHSSLKSMGVNYFAHVMMSCAKPPRYECGYEAMWDGEDPTNIGRKSNCERLSEVISTGDINGLFPFRVVYMSQEYLILEV